MAVRGWSSGARVSALLLFSAGAAFSGLAVAQISNQGGATAQQLQSLRELLPPQQRAVLDAAIAANANHPQATPQVTAPSTPAPPPAETGPPRIERASTLLINVSVNQSGDELLVDRRDRIHAENPYRLDGEGYLKLPFLPGIVLAGLTAEQAAQRLNADQRLHGLTFSATLLPLEAVGTEALRPFGYDVFREAPTTFAPATDIPVPPDYVLGPGDNIIVELFGKRSGSYSLVVDREGRLNLPEFGPLRVAGLKFDGVRSEINRRIDDDTLGVRASVTMSELRSIRVFVLGDVAHPGSYTVSGLSTVTHALFTSGGVSRVGSLRSVFLKRGGATIGQLDLYDLLLHGDGSNDRRLMSGDVVFVPPVGMTAAIDGRVLRPAIYELDVNATVGDLLALSGGVTPDADPRKARLERIDPDHERSVLDVDLTSAAGGSLALRPGDVLTIPRVLDDLMRGVVLEGHVQRAGRYAWHEGMRFTELLGSLDALKLNADQRYVLIRRERLPDRWIEVLSVDAVRAFAARGSERDPTLQSRDRVTVFSLQRDRGASLGELLDELRLQARDHESPAVVTVSGRVRAPGQYPLEPGMTVGDLVRAGGGLDEAAYALTAELTRFDAQGGEPLKTELLDLELPDVLSGQATANITLKPHDTLIIKETSDWNERGSIRIQGEVRFPGLYPIRKGETLSSVVRRAGGPTDHAFIEGAVLTRAEIRSREGQQIESLADRLQGDLALVALQSTQGTAADNQSSGQALAVGQSLLAQLRATRPTGRLVISLARALGHTGSDDDIELRDSDTLSVPPRRQYVTVIGETQNPTSHVWRRGLGRDDYLLLSGGPTQNSDASRIYVVRADGSVVGYGDQHWSRGARVGMRPGDTIVVPLDTRKVRPLALWTAVSTTVYNIAVAAAAVASF